MSVPATQLPPPGFPWAGRTRTGLPSGDGANPPTLASPADRHDSGGSGDSGGSTTAQGQAATPVPSPAQDAARRPATGPADACPLRLPAEDVSVPRARHAVDAWLCRHGADAEMRDQVALVLSELTANALTHTGSDWIVCGAALSPLGAAQGTVQVEVHDEGRPPRQDGAGSADGPYGPDGPHVVAPGADGREEDCQDGRGLHIVETLAARWGVTASPLTRGKAVWALLQA